MMELLAILGLLAVGITIIAVKEDRARQEKEYREILLLDLPKLEPVKKKAPVKKAAKKAAKKPAKKKPAKKAVKKAAKKAKKKPQPKKKKRASVSK